MEIKKGKIVKATKNELKDYWLQGHFDDVLSFPDFLEQIQEAGTEVIKPTRDPDRIDEITNELNRCWKKVPDWRLCQLIMNVTSKQAGDDPFYIEDDQFLEMLKNHFE